jgi:hypothetical protein
VDLRTCAVHDTASTAAGTFGMGLNAVAGARIRASECIVAGNRSSGVTAGYGGMVSLVDTEVSDTSPDALGAGGMGLVAMEGGVLTGQRVRVVRATGQGALVDGDASTLWLDDSAVEGTVPTPSGAFGRGLAAQWGGQLRMTGGSVVRNHDVGVFAADLGTSVQLTDTEVAETAVSPDGTGGDGILVQDGASVEVTDSVVRDNRSTGVLATGADTHVVLDGTQVLRTRADEHGRFGRGLNAQGGALLEATSCVVEAATETGVLALGDLTALRLRDSIVRGTLPGRELAVAIGIAAQTDSRLVATNVEVSGTVGPGGFVAGGARLELHGGSVVDNRFAGVAAVGGELELEETIVADNLPDASWGGGLGVYALGDYGPSGVRLTGVEVGPHGYAGVWLDGPGRYYITASDLAGGPGMQRGGWDLHGNALVARRGVSPWYAGVGLLLEATRLHGAEGVAVLLDDASATLRGLAFEDNGVDVWQQACGDAAPLEAADPSWTVCAGGNLIVDDSLTLSTLYIPEIDVEGEGR